MHLRTPEGIPEAGDTEASMRQRVRIEESSSAANRFSLPLFLSLFFDAFCFRFLSCLFHFAFVLVLSVVRCASPFRMQRQLLRPTDCCCC